MNEGFESILNALTGVAQSAVSKAKSLSSIAKSNVSILTEQEKLKKAYAELGKLYYRDYITGEEPDDAEYLPLCDNITELVKTIQTLRESIDDAKAGAEKDAEIVISDEELDKAIAEELEDLNEDLKDLEEELADLEEERKELEDAKAEIQAEIQELTEKKAAAETPTEIKIEVVEDSTEVTEE